MNVVKSNAEWLLVLVTIIAAGGWLFSKEALEGMPPLFFIGTRFFLAGVVLLVFYPKGIKYLMPPKMAISTVALGLLMAVALVTWILGLSASEHLGEGAFINSLGFIFIPVLGRILFKDKIALSHWLSLPIAVIGLGLLSLESGFTLRPEQLYFLASSSLIALHFTFISRLASHAPAIALAGVQLTIVGITATLVSMNIEVWPEQFSSSIVSWFLASTLLATSLRFGLQTFAQGLAPASHVALIMILEPVWTALFASFWFAETMSVSQLLGCGLIFGALLVSRWQWCRKIFNRLRGKKYIHEQ